jgi:5-methylcytosine-specific restriction enzyme subunit McrC
VSRLELTEWEVRTGIELAPSHVAALASSKYLAVAPDPRRVGAWQITAQNHVGVIVTDGLEIRVRPKVSVGRLLVLLSRHLGQVSFTPELVDWGTDDDLTSILAAVFTEQVERLIAGGLLNGYRSVDESLLTIRGRIDMGRHVAARAGLPLPVEVTYDDFTIDIVENALLAGAVQRLLRAGGLEPTIRYRLRRINMLLNDIHPVFSAHTANEIAWGRLNDRYRVPIGLAALVLSSTTIEDTAGSAAQASSFVVDMNRIFEAEVLAGLRQASRGSSLTVVGQHSASLDHGRNLSIRPDIAVLRDGELVAIADTKYKQPDLKGIGASDVYQVLAYAHRFRLQNVHLIYPVRPPLERLLVGDVTVHLHQVDLETPEAARRDAFEKLLGTLAGVPSPLASS